MGQTVAVVLAGGRGKRVGADRNKVLIEVAGRTVIEWSVRAFASHPAIERTILVAHPDDAAELRVIAAAYGDVTVIGGGAERADSERAALDHLRRDITDGALDAVLIHDGARPCISARLIASTATMATECGVLPALPTPPLATIERGILQPVDGRLVRAQTPQGAPASWLLRAYDEARDEGFTGTDTASYLEHAGFTVRVIDGERSNIKVTYRQDLEAAAELLR